MTCGHSKPCGCPAASCCFLCPLPRCRYDDGGRDQERTAERVRRAAEAARLRRLGLSTAEVARATGTSQRTASRMLGGR